jgi:hypothetical protein
LVCAAVACHSDSCAVRRQRDGSAGADGDCWCSVNIAQKHPLDGNPAEPALPNTGALLKVRPDGTLEVIVEGLNQPTSVEFIGETAYVVTLGGEIWKINLTR